MQSSTGTVFKVFAIVFTIILFPSFELPAEESGRTMFENGQTYYSNGKYLEALYFFNELIKDKSAEFEGDAWFWAAKSYLAAGEIDSAEKNLEYFLLNFPRNSNYNEGFYYKGRILFIQKEFDKAVDLFNRFIRSSPFSPFVSNAYFWIGDSLYNSGYFDDALEMFRKVVDEYPASFKFEASQYKISLIELRTREEELLRLIRWSHEESIKSIEEYRNREKNYLQTIEAYQKRIIEMESGNTGVDSESLRRLNAAAEKLENYLESLKTENSGNDYEREN